jgi:hypothetical protein
MKIPSVLAVALCLAGVLRLPGASATTAPLGWTERAVAYGHLSITFRIDRLVLEKRSWSATMAMRNWDIALSVDERFALLASSARSGTAEIRTLPVTRVQPALPRVLGVRQGWHGTIGGRGSPPRGSYLRLRLGVFHAVIAPNLVIRHVTRHTYRLP